MFTDGTDLIGWAFNDPDLGLCRVVEVGSPHPDLGLSLARATSTQPAPNSKPAGSHPAVYLVGWGYQNFLLNLDIILLLVLSISEIFYRIFFDKFTKRLLPRTPPPSLRWRSGSKPWLPPTLPHPHLYYMPHHLIHHPPHSLRLHHNAAKDPALPHPHLIVLPPPPYTPPPTLPPLSPQRRHCLQALLSSASATTTAPPVYPPAPADLNLDGAGKLLSFSSAIRGPHGKEWTLADEQELIKLLVTIKCLLPVMRPAKTPTYLKRVVKEKWDEVHRLRKRRVRWTIGVDRIEVGYDVGTNTAYCQCPLPFHCLPPIIFRQRLTEGNYNLNWQLEWPKYHIVGTRVFFYKPPSKQEADSKGRRAKHIDHYVGPARVTKPIGIRSVQLEMEEPNGRRNITYKRDIGMLLIAQATQHWRFRPHHTSKSSGIRHTSSFR
jgi:hypothetical protein